MYRWSKCDEALPKFPLSSLEIVALVWPEFKESAPTGNEMVEGHEKGVCVKTTKEIQLLNKKQAFAEEDLLEGLPYEEQLVFHATISS